MPLAAILAQLLDLPGLDPRDAHDAKSKLRFAQRLGSGGRYYAVPRTAPADVRDPAALALHDQRPSLLKLEHGSSAAAVIDVDSNSPLRAQVGAVGTQLVNESSWAGVGLGFSNQLVISELIPGPEFDVDIVMWRSEMWFSIVTANGPTALTHAEVSALMPAAVSPQTERALKLAAQEVCRDMGLNNGCFNIEMIMGVDKPHIIDINARMGGFYIRDWVLRLTDYDLLDAAVAIALDQEPPGGAVEERGHVAGIMLLPSLFSKWLAGAERDSRWGSAAGTPATLCIQFDANWQRHPLVDEPWGCLAAEGGDPALAMRHLTHLVDLLRLGEESRSSLESLAKICDTVTRN